MLREEKRMEVSKRRRYFYFILLSLTILPLIFLSGCLGKKEEVDVMMTADGKPTTSDGIKISFEEGYPPAQIKQDDIFDAFVRVQNRGSYSVKSEELLVDLLASDFNIAGSHRWTTDVLIKGIGDGSFGEDLTIETFGKLSYDGLIFQGKELPSELEIKSCYYYETIASGQICLLPSAEIQSEICSDEGNKVEVHSSAPVHVTSILEKIFPASTELKIKVENVGDGLPYGPKDSSCSDKLKTKNYVVLERLMLGEEDITNSCGSEAERRKRMSDGELTFNCEYSKPVQTVRTEQLDVVISYRYSTSISKSIKVFA